MKNILPSVQNDFASWPWTLEQAFLFVFINQTWLRHRHELVTKLISVSAKLWSGYWWNNPKRNPRWITYSSYEILIPIGSSPRSGSSLNRFWSSIFSFVNFYQFSISYSLAPYEALVCLNSAPSGRLETNLGIFNSKLAAKNMFNYFTDITQFICFEFWQRRHY